MSKEEPTDRETCKNYEPIATHIDFREQIVYILGVEGPTVVEGPALPEEG